MIIFHIIRRLSMAAPAAILILGFSQLRAQEIIINAELDTNRALIGDQLRLHLSVEKPVGVNITFPAFKDTITHKIEIVSETDSDTNTVQQNREVLSRDLLITVFDTGFFEIPSLPFIANIKNSYDTLLTSPIHFEIVAMKSDTSLRDIKGNYKAPLNVAEIYAYIKEYYPYGLVAGGLGLLIWYLVRYIRRRLGRGKLVYREVIRELPEVIALRELEKLKEEKPWLHQKVKLYFISLSEILRSYIENRFQIMALEQTTDEILRELKATDCEASDHSRLAGILRLADLVKFAKVIPAEEENALQVDLAVGFVHSTSSPAENEIKEGTLRKSNMHGKMINENA
jgi:hypothetical protein